VEISNKGSSRLHLVAGLFQPLGDVPSKILSPIWGITMSTAMIALLFSLNPNIAPVASRQKKTFFAFGKKCSSRVGAYGTGVSSEVTRMSGPSRSGRPFRKVSPQSRRDSAGLRVFVHDQAFVGLYHRAHEQPAGAPALDRQPVLDVPLLLMRYSAVSTEVEERILLLPSTSV